MAFSTEGWRMTDEEVEQALQSGEHQAELEQYFGSRHYRELRELKQQEQRRQVRGGPRVLVLPGIMGSKLGRKRGALLPDDMYWFDPVDFAFGKIKRLILGEGGDAKVIPIGVFQFAYMKLKLQLRIAGYRADFYPFDWRQSIDTLGVALKKHINEEEDGEVSLVAHSMGGLVARAAMKEKAKVKQLIMLGTPNYGSFSPVQALRATHPTVQKLAKLANTEPQALAREIFSTFYGLCQMLPSPERYSATNFFDMAAWPATGPQPRANILKKSAELQSYLAPADSRFFLIAGYNKSTYTSARLENGEYKFDPTNDGDGTVPLAFARIDGARTYYVEESHGSLPNNGTVFRAVKDLLDRGTTDALPDTLPTRTRAMASIAGRPISEGEMRQYDPYPGRRGGQLTAYEVRHVIDELASPESRDEPTMDASGELSLTPSMPGTVAMAGAGGEGGFRHQFDRFTVSRLRQHRLDLQLYQGSITDVDARAYVVGIFHAVAPSGAAAAIDQRLGGAISEFSKRRMFGGAVGEMFMMPAARRRLRSEFVLFAGLGDFDRFGDEVQQLVAENVIRTFLETRVEDFATVLIGANGGQRVEQTLLNLLSGFVNGLLDADGEGRFRCVTICENNPQRYQQIKAELFRLSSTQLFKDVAVTFDELPPQPPDRLGEPPTVAERGRKPEVADPTYLLVRQEGEGKEVYYSAAILTAGSKASVFSEEIKLDRDALERKLLRLESELSLAEMKRFGEELATMVLPPNVLRVLRGLPDTHLVVVHDAALSRVPWETIQLDGWTPALRGGLSHRYFAGDLSVAKYLEARLRRERLEMLLVVNPTEDLPGAKAEGKAIYDRFKNNRSVRMTKLEGKEATRTALLSHFRSGRFDVLHYAGHAAFDPINRAQSGVKAANGEVVTGGDLASIGNLPSLVFFNACESARVRRGADKKKKDLDISARVQRNVGLAEAYLRGGVANFIGTYWPVGDSGASTMAGAFYDAVLEGKAIGEALNLGRKALYEAGNIDWADFIHYGSHDFVLKLPPPDDGK